MPCLAVSLMLLPLVFRGALVDDSFIYLRVTENILSGRGWVFNAGEYTNPCTSPLYVLLLVVLGLTGIRGPESLLVASGFGLAAIGLVHYAVFREKHRNMAVVLAAAAATNILLLRSIGLETPLFLAAILTTSVLYQYGFRTLVGVSAGLAALLRPEGIALIPLIIAADYLFERRLRWRSVLGAAAIVAPWVVFSCWYFGSPLPHSVVIKAMQRHVGIWAQQRSWPVAFLEAQAAVTITLPLALVGAVYAYRSLRSHWRFLFIWIGFCLAQVGGYSVFGAPVGYWWYFVPGTQAIITLAVVGIFAIHNALVDHVSLRAAARARATRWAITFGVAVAVGTLFFLPLLAPRPQPTATEYRDVASWLVAHTDATADVAASEIGYIGYYSGRRITDINGLLHRAALSPIRSGRLSWWFEAETPDFIVTHASALPGEPSKDWPPELYGKFTECYEAVLRSRGVVLYKYRGASLAR